MPKYRLSFKIEDLIQKLIPDANPYVECIGFDKMEVTITTTRALTTTEINNAKAKLPFMEAERLE